MRRANIVKEVRVVHVTVSALLLLSGILIVAWPELDTEALQWLIGINLIVTGAARVLGYYANDLYRLAFQYDLAMGPFCIILGVLWLIYPQRYLHSAQQAYAPCRKACFLHQLPPGRRPYTGTALSRVRAPACIRCILLLPFLR